MGEGGLRVTKQKKSNHHIYHRVYSQKQHWEATGYFLHYLRGGERGKAFYFVLIDLISIWVRFLGEMVAVHQAHPGFGCYAGLRSRDEL